MQKSSASRDSSKNSWEVLSSFWNQIPRTAFIDAGKEVIESHPARAAILRILRDGIQDENVISTDTEKIRRALNADEIREILEKTRKIKLSKTGMYFHLEVLEKAGFIKIVSKILIGRHRVKYYGRVAHHLFISDPEMRLKKYERLFKILQKFTKSIAPEKTVSEFKSMPKRFLKIKIERERIIGEWLVNNDHLIKKLGIELNELFEAVKLIDSCNPAYQDLFNNLNEILRIE